MTDLIPIEMISTKILILRGKRVMLDKDLAELYGVPTKVLNQSVRRNIRRFPVDFMFQLTKLEKLELVTICDRFRSLKHSTVEPYVFTEQGVAMLSSVLNSERAIRVNIQIMRAFIKLKELLLTHKDLAIKIDALEKKYANHDEQIKIIFEAIKQLLEPSPVPKKPQIGFR